MFNAIGAFFSLYLATLVLLTGSGLFNTYMGLRLTQLSVSEIWVGALLAIFYLGLVFGARVGHKLILGIGHIRAYAASAALVTVAVLIQIMVDNLWIWLVLRFVAGAAMVTQFIGIESWLNEQTENEKRGTVFAFYMVMTSLGTVLGQVVLTYFPEMNYEPLIFVAICSVMSLVPVALTRRLHPALQVPAPINAKYYLERVPLSISVLLIAGMVTGAFYALAPVYGLRAHLNSEQVAMFVAISVAAGVLAQWPVGWLADRIGRVLTIRINAVFLLLLALPLVGWVDFSYTWLLVFSAAFGVLQFTLYPLGAAFANDNVDPERRVGLSAILYMVYGIGACIGPLLVGVLMDRLGSHFYFIFVVACGALLVFLVRPQKITGNNLSQDAPTEYVPMPSMQTSAAAVALDPRIDISSDISHDPVIEEPTELNDPQTDPKSAEPEQTDSAYKESASDDKPLLSEVSKPQ
ncbi:MFS transporter [uncultured Paenalcaligenes sp.]|uniref:MFS transporter n=1 Tax=uncultured Paenalcaligenes sp. TaxID=1588925 RepID=UPI002631A6E8|nr:MFS transporter [uncultured Paenalcaligenes sp.]